MRELKTFKATAGAEPGTYEAIVAVFGNVDLAGDRVMPGAFTRTLAERGLPPVYFSHGWGLGPIGETLAAEERDVGLWVKGLLWVDADPLVERVYRSMMADQLKEFSFAYETKAYRFVEEDGKEIRELVDVDLFEQGPTLVGMNPDTELLQVASFGLGSCWSEGRLKHANAPAHLQAAHDSIVKAGAKCSTDEGDDGKSGRDPAVTINPRLIPLWAKTRHEEDR